MKKVIFTLGLLFAFCTGLYAQGGMELGAFLGMSTYNGDLQGERINLDESHLAVGALFRKYVYKGLDVRLGATFTTLSGADRHSSSGSTRLRNLDFKTFVSDFQLLAEYNFMDITERRFTPYVFAGIGVYHFNPYTADSLSNKVYLQPLSTEGQGLSEYPDRDPYKLTQLSIPFGVGVKYAINDQINIGAELSLRKTFTDYLDDVSNTYVDRNVLEKERGANAAYFAWRTKELPGHENDPYPADGSFRGSPKHKDWYYFAGLTVTFNLGSGRYGGALRSLNCPTYQ
ncbi:DUF6089 family protein [Compostibacter hankyongensis]|uniref:type IX secretion system protein PorG n=1 Tax=Compostibacter hankyongensis TaxID=1007089 RepID=UPI0031E93678